LNPDPRRSARLLAVLAMGSLATWACADPCALLEERVCESREQRKRCELMQDPERRSLLSGEACEGILQVWTQP
jgi:hypothetical protein